MQFDHQRCSSQTKMSFKYPQISINPVVQSQFRNHPCGNCISCSNHSSNPKKTWNQASVAFLPFSSLDWNSSKLSRGRGHVEPPLPPAAWPLPMYRGRAGPFSHGKPFARATRCPPFQSVSCGRASPHPPWQSHVLHEVWPKNLKEDQFRASERWESLESRRNWPWRYVGHLPQPRLGVDSWWILVIDWHQWLQWLGNGRSKWVMMF